MGKPPVQWNCEGCENSGLLSPPQEPVWVQDGEIEVPEKDESGKLVYDEVDLFDDYGRPVKDEDGKQVKTKKQRKKKQPKMVNLKRKSKRQDSVTGQFKEVEVPEMKDLATRIYMVQMRVGEESVQRYVCKSCLDTLIPFLKPVKERLERMNQ